MRRWHLVLILVLLGLSIIPPITAGYAQDEPESPPRVVFIEDKSLYVASTLDPGPDGLTKLEQAFIDLGAQTEWQHLSEPLPEDADVVVIVRPTRAIPADYIARLWVHLSKGHHLLLAVDPSSLGSQLSEGIRYPSTDKSTSGLSKILMLFYGIQFEDTVLVEPWYSNTTLTNQLTAFLPASAEDIVPHPIMAPLERYDLPIQLWGARNLRVEPFGMSNYAVPLLYTTLPYGEANTRVFPRGNNEPEPLELNLDKDEQGRLFPAAVGENTRRGSRVAVLGDAEIFLNSFGLETNSLGEPVHIGDWLLTQRLAAWLLGLPEDEWPTLPAAYTQLALDGQADDWADLDAIVTDGENEIDAASFDIQKVYAFRDDSFLYVNIATIEPPSPSTRVRLQLETNFDGVPDLEVLLTPEQVTLVSDSEADSVVSDGALAIDTILELRLPLRIMNEGALLSQICLSDSRTALGTAQLDCTDLAPVIIPVANTTAPVDVRFSPGPRLMVDTLEAGVNVRAAPNTDSNVVEIVPNRQLFAVTGRTALGDWLQISNARYTGWIADFLVDVNSDFSNIPIVNPTAAATTNAGENVAAADTDAAVTVVASSGSRQHIVASGETLSGIALQYGITLEALAAANNIENPSQISVGQVLVIPDA